MKLINHEEVNFMKKVKRLLAIALVVVMLMSVMGVAANAVYYTSSYYGYMMPANSKLTKTVTTVNLYGNYDYIDFYVNSYYSDVYYFYSICSDKDYENEIDSGFFYCDDYGEYSGQALITLKGKYKTGTYYGFTWAAYMDSSGEMCVSKYSIEEFKIKVDRTTSFSKQMVVTKDVKNTVNGPQINWQGLSGASKYYIYRRSMTGSSWTKVGTAGSSARSFVDKTLKNKNAKYIYTVKGVNKNGTSSRFHYLGEECLFAKAPTLKSVATTTDNSIKVQWNSTGSSAYYEVYRREAGKSGWTKLTGNCKNTYYNDTKAVNGKTYEYTVRANINTTDGVAKSSYYGNSNKTVKFLKAPDIGSLYRNENGVRIAWYGVSGANAYTIYRKPIDGSAGWTTLKKVSGSTRNYVDTTADGSYIYTVRSEGANGRGSYNSGIKYLELEAPEVYVEEEYSYYGEDAVRIEWSEVEGAYSYDVYSRKEGGEWTLLDGDPYYSYVTDEVDEVGVTEYTVVANAYYHDDLYNRDFYYSSDPEVNAVAYEFYPEIDISLYPYSYYEEVDIDASYSDWVEEVYVYRKLADEPDSALEYVGTVYDGYTFTDNDVVDNESYTYVFTCIYYGKTEEVEVYRETVHL